MMPGPREILFDSVKSLERHVSGFHILAPFLTSTAPREAALKEMLGKIMDMVGADAGAVVLAENGAETFDFAALRWVSLSDDQAAANEKAIRAFKVKTGEGIVGQVFQTGEPVVIPDAPENSIFQKQVAAAAHYTVRNMVAVPILSNGKSVGVLELLNKRPRGTFTASDLGLAVSVAHQLGVTLELWRERAANAGPTGGMTFEEALEIRRQARDAQSQLKETRDLLETAVQGRDQETKRAQALSDELDKARRLAEAPPPAHQLLRLIRAMEPIVFAPDVEGLISHLASMAVRLVSAANVTIYRWDKISNRFERFHQTSPSDQGPSSFSLGEGLAGRAAEKKEFLASSDGEVPSLAGPLMVDGAVWGIVQATGEKGGKAFAPDHRISLEGLALVGSSALARAGVVSGDADSENKPSGA